MTNINENSNSNFNKIEIVVIDDDVIISNMRNTVEKAQMEINDNENMKNKNIQLEFFYFQNPIDYLTHLKTHKPTLVFMDLNLADGLYGEDVVWAITNSQDTSENQPSYYLLTGASKEEFNSSPAYLKFLGITDYITKGTNELQKKLRSIISQKIIDTMNKG